MAPLMIPRRLSVKTFILLLVQCIIFMSILKIWISYNGGLTPWFLAKHSAAMSRRGLGADMANFFPSARGDGARVTWAHAVNSREQLKEALTSSVMCLEADVILRNEGTPTQELVPIMAHPPVVDSDLTLTAFLDTVLTSVPPRAIKLDFKSLPSVELSLEMLRSRKAEIAVPLWLNADILPGPNSGPEDAVVDAAAFLAKALSILPGCTLSLGWATRAVASPPTPPSSAAAYSWTDVKRMYDVLKHSGLTSPRDGPPDSSSPVTFAIRAALLHGSTSPLKWLCEQLGASLTIFSSPKDASAAVDLRELLYLRSRMPLHLIYYDMPADVGEAFLRLAGDGGTAERHVSDDHRLHRQRAYRHSEWALAVADPSSELLAGEDAVMMRGSGAIIKSLASASYGTHVHVLGSVRFLPAPAADGQPDSAAEAAASSSTSFELYVFGRDLAPYGTGVGGGIRCSIGADGQVAISSAEEERIKLATQSKSLATAGDAVPPTSCYQFEMTVTAQGQISFYVQAPTVDCHVFKVIDKYNLKNVELSVTIPERSVRGVEYSVYAQASDLASYVVLEQLTISSGRPS